MCLLLGCASRHLPLVTGPGGPLPDAGRLYREIRDRASEVHSVKGMARVRVRGEGRKGRFDAVIASDRSGRLRFEALDLMDHVVFLALFSRDGFLTYSVPDNLYVKGPDDPHRIGRTLGIPLNAEGLSALVLGDPFFLPLEQPVVHLCRDRDALLLDVEGAHGGPRFLVWLDGEKRPKRVILVRDAADEEPGLQIQVDLSRYRSVDSVSFPFRLRVSEPGTTHLFEIDYRGIRLNEPLGEDLFRFVPPPDALEGKS